MRLSFFGVLCFLLFHLKVGWLSCSGVNEIVWPVSVLAFSLLKFWAERIETERKCSLQLHCHFYLDILCCVETACPAFLPVIVSAFIFFYFSDCKVLLCEGRLLGFLAALRMVSSQCSILTL